MKTLLTFLSIPTLASALTVADKTIPEPLAPLVSTALETADSNRSQIESAFDRIPAAQVEGLAFLVAHMPAGDLTSLTAEYLAENVSLAYHARASVPWGKDLSDERFFNDVLPYASINERRDNWRKDFTDRFLPLVEQCKTPGEAAQVLNQKMWDLIDVRYHATKRPKPDQSPYESIDAGYASCSGLSVLLIDACRAVAVPARFVGTPRWATKRGNHSWVEVWDTDGQWHFTGACEYNKNGLDQTWFANDAARAISEIPANAIYATSWKPADTSFPLVWDRSIGYVQAANVTGSYARPDVPKPHRTFIQVFSSPGGPRVPCRAVVSRDGKPFAGGTTRGPGHDTNDMLAVALKPGATYNLAVTRPDGSTLTQPLKAPQEPDRQITIYLGQPADTSWLPAGAAAAKYYTAHKTESTIDVDGKLDDPAWQNAPRSPGFVDLISGAETSYKTQAAVRWTDTHLYVAYWVEEPDVQAELTEPDSNIWSENDIEFFIAGDDAYYEFELNARNTRYEAAFVWASAYHSGGFADDPTFDLDADHVIDFNGVDFKTHPRGPRIGFMRWDLPGLQTAVHIDGTLNDNSDTDRGWTVELAIPWAGLAPFARSGDRSLPPKDGDTWRCDFSRFNKNKHSDSDSGGWAWSQHGVWDSHIPEAFSHIHFSTSNNP